MPPPFERAHRCGDLNGARPMIGEFGRWRPRLCPSALALHSAGTRAGMDGESFGVTLARLDGYARVELHGEFDYTATTEHADELQEVSQIPTRVVLDLSDITFMGTAGVRFLAELVQGHRGRVRVERASRVARSIIEMTGFAAALDMPR
jgi:anti-anti-sigma factor